MMIPGKYAERDLPDYSSRNFEERGFTVGIGGSAFLEAKIDLASCP